MGKSGALSCLNEPRDEQKHKPQLFPAGLGEPLFDRRNAFILIRHDTASPSPGSWGSGSSAYQLEVAAFLPLPFFRRTSAGVASRQKYTTVRAAIWSISAV